MKPPSSKSLRTVGRELHLLFSKSGFFRPKSIEDFKFPNSLSYEFTIPGMGHFLFTQKGMTSLRRIAGCFDDEDVFEGTADYPDIHRACVEVVAVLLSKGQMPESGTEMLECVDENLRSKCETVTFLVALYGVELKDIEGCRAGHLQIMGPSKEHLVELQQAHFHEDDVDSFLEYSKGFLWMTGSVLGTPRVALAKFQSMAHLVTGVLAMVAATLYERGAHAFRIGVVMSPEAAFGKAKYLSWSSQVDSGAVTHKFVGSQPLVIDEAMRRRIEESIVCKKAFAVVNKECNSELDLAIQKALYWYSDAHRDQVIVMRLLKYWSCVETLFTVPKRVVRSVSTGLASLLVFGPTQFVHPSDYQTIVRRVIELYAKRSKATHGAGFDHVTDKDAEELSQWVAWMLYNAIEMAAHGFQSRHDLKYYLSCIRRKDMGAD